MTLRISTPKTPFEESKQANRTLVKVYDEGLKSNETREGYICFFQSTATSNDNSS